jgi:hypothetical protein
MVLHGDILWTTMTKIQIDLDKEEDKIVEVYKLVNDLNTKEEAIKKMVRYFKVKIIPEKLSKQEEYYKNALKFGEDEK